MRMSHVMTLACLFLLISITIGCRTPSPVAPLAAARAQLYLKEISQVPYKIQASIQDTIDTTARQTTTLDSKWDILEKDSQKIVVASPNGRRRTFDRKVTTTNPDLKAVLVSSLGGTPRVVAIDDSITFSDEDYIVFDIRPYRRTVILMRTRDHGRVVIGRQSLGRKTE